MSMRAQGFRELAVLLAAIAVGGCASREKAAKPNIVIVLADDLGYADLGCYGPDSKIPTPNLDRLAAEGMRFTDAHSPSSVCTPTRYGLLTGRYCWRTVLTRGVLDGFDPPLIEPERLNLASMLKGQGYATACVGKWHLGMQWTRQDGTAVEFRNFASGFRPGYDVDYSKPVAGGPAAIGFDSYFGISASLDMSPYAFIDGDRTAGVPAVKTPLDRNLFMNQVPGVRTEDFTLEGVMPALAGRAASFIEDHARQKPGQPFFLYLPLSAPHLPVVPNAEYEGRSGAGKYGDFVVEVDAVAGRVMTALEDAGVADDTLFFFTSDNGGLWHWWDYQEADDLAHGEITPRGEYVKGFGHRSNGDLRGTKADIWEGGHRVPFIVRWPGRVKAQSVTGHLVCLTDLMATLAEITGADLPAGAAEDSFSLAPVLLDRAPATPVREAIVHHSSQGMFSIREGDWKLVLGRGSGGFSTPRQLKPQAGEPDGQLYNLREDPQETKNVYPDHPEIVERLTRLLEKYQAEGRSAPLPE